MYAGYRNREFIYTLFALEYFPFIIAQGIQKETFRRWEYIATDATSLFFMPAEPPIARRVREGFKMRRRGPLCYAFPQPTSTYSKETTQLRLSRPFPEQVA